MSVHRRQGLVDAPIEVVWGLVATPSRYPEWWPRVIEVRGERFEEGDEYAQVTRVPMGRAETNFLLERRDDLREIRMRCRLTGMYADWMLTPAQGGTFVEVEMGMEPRRLGDRIVDRTLGKVYLRRWTTESLDGLREAALRGREGARA
jgi:uncharacterized protein YndB with AHSA1/START domain